MSNLRHNLRLDQRAVRPTLLECEIQTPTPIRRGPAFPFHPLFSLLHSLASSHLSSTKALPLSLPRAFSAYRPVSLRSHPRHYDFLSARRALTRSVTFNPPRSLASSTRKS